MSDCVILRVDFDRAGRGRFIQEYLGIADQSAELYARQPGISNRDIGILTLDISPSEKYSNLAERLPPDHSDLPPERRENARLLIAGVIVHERLRQAREWLGFYEGCAGAVDACSLAEFPRLNVRREVAPVIYDRMMAQSFPPHVDYALKTSDRVFLGLKTRHRHLRATCGGPRIPDFS